MPPCHRSFILSAFLWFFPLQTAGFAGANMRWIFGVSSRLLNARCRPSRKGFLLSFRSWQGTFLQQKTCLPSHHAKPFSLSSLALKRETALKFSSRQQRISFLFASFFQQTLTIIEKTQNFPAQHGARNGFARALRLAKLFLFPVLLWHIRMAFNLLHDALHVPVQHRRRLGTHAQLVGKMRRQNGCVFIL